MQEPINNRLTTDFSVVTFQHQNEDSLKLITYLNRRIFDDFSSKFTMSIKKRPRRLQKVCFDLHPTI